MQDSGSNVYTRLSENDKKQCIALGSSYGRAGALEYWSKTYDMPPVYSAHNNYWLWGPPPEERGVFIMSGFRRAMLEKLFYEVTLADEVEILYAQENNIPVWLCRGLKRPAAVIWEEIKIFI